MNTKSSFAVLASALGLVLACAGSDGNSNREAEASGAGGGASNAGGGANDDSSRVVVDGYVTAGPWAGFGFTATDPGAATIIPDCSGAAGCTPPFTGSKFCMQGTVTGRADYTGFAMLGWNLKQTAAGTPETWAVPESGGIRVTVANRPATTALRVQLQGTDPHDSADRWCAALVDGELIPWTAFKTNCWQGGTPQNALTPGTMLQQGAILIPGLLTDLPFDVCLIDIQIEP